jgi:hypothetical protein
METVSTPELRAAQAALDAANHMYRDAMGLIDIATQRVRAERWRIYKEQQLIANERHMDESKRRGV